jgi:hypothetical protein
MVLANSGRCPSQHTVCLAATTHSVLQAAADGLSLQNSSHITRLASRLNFLAAARTDRQRLPSGTLGTTTLEREPPDLTLSWQPSCRCARILPVDNLRRGTERNPAPARTGHRSCILSVCSSCRIAGRLRTPGSTCSPWHPHQPGRLVTQTALHPAHLPHQGPRERIRRACRSAAMTASRTRTIAFWIQ